MLWPMTSGDPDLGELLESDGSAVIATFSLHKRLSERCGLHLLLSAFCASYPRNSPSAPECGCDARSLCRPRGAEHAVAGQLARSAPAPQLAGLRARQRWRVAEPTFWAAAAACSDCRLLLHRSGAAAAAAASELMLLTNQEVEEQQQAERRRGGGFD